MSVLKKRKRHSSKEQRFIVSFESQIFVMDSQGVCQRRIERCTENTVLGHADLNSNRLILYESTPQNLRLCMVDITTDATYNTFVWQVELEKVLGVEYCEYQYAVSTNKKLFAINYGNDIICYNTYDGKICMRKNINSAVFHVERLEFTPDQDRICVLYNNSESKDSDYGCFDGTDCLCVLSVNTHEECCTIRTILDGHFNSCDEYLYVTANNVQVLSVKEFILNITTLSYNGNVTRTKIKLLQKHTTVIRKFGNFVSLYDAVYGRIILYNTETHTMHNKTKCHVIPHIYQMHRHDVFRRQLSSDGKLCIGSGNRYMLVDIYSCRIIFTKTLDHPLRGIRMCNGHLFVWSKNNESPHVELMQ